MAKFCLLPQSIERFKRALTDGTLNPDQLSKISSDERRNLLASIVGEDNAKAVNAEFESKLLLKNQQAGMVNWAKKVLGLRPLAKRDIISRIEKMDKVLNPLEQGMFLKDLAERRLGIGVSDNEAKIISNLSQKMIKTRETIKQGGNRLDYGAARVELLDYVGELKGQAEKLKPMGYLVKPLRLISDIAGIAKAVKASMDNSAIFRQGWKSLWTNPGIWLKNAALSFSDLVKTLGNKKVMEALKADLYSRENALNGNYEKMKLAIGVIEEAYPTHLPGKIPIFGRAYKASETAFTGFVYRQRADIADKLLEIAKRSGVNIADEFELRSIGKLVNSLTGRGELGVFEKTAGAVNNIFFSPRFLKSQIDTLLLHPTDRMSAFARKEAAKNLVKIILGTGTVLTIARSISPESVELDPRSADFGKIRIGDTRFDVSGGMASIVTLASRLALKSTKSSTTGKIYPLNELDKEGKLKFGAQTGTDIIYNFFENKLSPAAQVVKETLITRTTFEGKPITVSTEIKNLFAPFIYTNYEELKNNPNSANILAAMIADALGIATKTYSAELKKETTKKQINITQDFSEIFK